MPVYPGWDQGGPRRAAAVERHKARDEEQERWKRKCEIFLIELSKPEYTLGMVHRTETIVYSSEFDTSNEGLLILDMKCWKDWRDKWVSILSDQVDAYKDLKLIRTGDMLFLIKHSTRYPQSPPHQWTFP